MAVLNRRRARAARSLAVTVLAGAGFALACAWDAAFLPGPPTQQQRLPRSVAERGSSGAHEELSTGAAAALALLPVLLASEPALAFEWKDAVVGPLELINTGLNLYKAALGIYALMSWLGAFGILNPREEIVMKVQGALASIIDPVLGPLRNIIPAIAGFDISFMLLWFVIEQAQAAAVSIMFGAMSYGVVSTASTYY